MDLGFASRRSTRKPWLSQPSYSSFLMSIGSTYVRRSPIDPNLFTRLSSFVRRNTGNEACVIISVRIQLPALAFQQFLKPRFVDHVHPQLARFVELRSRDRRPQQRNPSSCSPTRIRVPRHLRSSSSLRRGCRFGNVPVRTNVLPASCVPRSFFLPLNCSPASRRRFTRSRFFGSSKNSRMLTRRYAVQLPPPPPGHPGGGSSSNVAASISASIDPKCSARNCAVRSPTKRMPSP